MVLVRLLCILPVCFVAFCLVLYMRIYLKKVGKDLKELPLGGRGP